MSKTIFVKEIRHFKVFFSSLEANFFLLHMACIFPLNNFGFVWKLFSDITYLDHLYLASQASLLQFLWEKDAEDILIIGHNEGLSDLASYCMGAEIHLKTCSYIKINISASNWQESIAAKGQILDFYRPLI